MLAICKASNFEAHEGAARPGKVKADSASDHFEMDLLKRKGSGATEQRPFGMWDRICSGEKGRAAHAEEDRKGEEKKKLRAD